MGLGYLWLVLGLTHCSVCSCGDFSSLISDCPSPPYAVSQPEACVSMEAVSDSHTVTVSMDSSEISMIIDSIKKECLASGAANTAGSSKDHCMDGKEDLDLAEKMDIAVSYTGEELDFDTVGNIIAIIEDKVNGESTVPLPFAPHSVGFISNDCCSLIYFKLARNSYSRIVSPSFSRSVGKDSTAACLTLVLLFREQKEMFLPWRVGFGSCPWYTDEPCSQNPFQECHTSETEASGETPTGSDTKLATKVNFVNGVDCDFHNYLSTMYFS